MQNLDQSWLESAKCYNFISKQLPPRWNIHTQSVVFNLQNELHRYNEFLFRTSAATLIEKEKRKGMEISTGEGVGGNEVPFMATYANIYIRLSFWQLFLTSNNKMHK